MTLLEKAKKNKGEKLPEKDLMELALAWAKDEIRYSDVMAATGLTSSSTYCLLAKNLKEIIKRSK